jgi:hypothetical protein
MHIKQENQLKRSEFESGQMFLIPSDTNLGAYKLDKYKGCTTASLSKRVGDGFRYFCNVRSINNKFFTYYLYILGKQVRGKVLYSDCLKYNDEPSCQ